MNSVKVAIRVRPLISRENGAEVYWTYDTHEIKSDGRRDPYIFDRVFGSDEETRDVYEEIVEPIVEEAMKGFNGTVFAYGQTSSGKTYTMMGSPNGHNPGIIPMAVRDTFSHIQKTPEREFLLRVSYVEIYNEVLKDLLVQPSDAVPLQIRDDEFRNVVVQGLSEHLVSSEADVLELIKKGGKRRQTAGTNMNERSSRSHTIFRMILESRERVDANSTKDSVECEMAVKISQLNLVDLAGSERAHQTGAEGQRFKEGCHINSSLSLLGKVINQICKASENSKGSAHISYRDSKLTRILQPSLGGNALTAIICAVTPVSFVDTDSTLRFASNAKMIKNKPHVNEVLSDEAMLIRQKREINQLKKKIQELELNADKKKNEELESMLIEKEQLQHEQEERIARLKQMLLVSSQPVDTKRQRNVRRETWCPGLKPGLAGASQWGSPKRHLSAINQSSLLNLDHDLRDVEFAPCVKRTRFSDDPVATVFQPATVSNDDKETSETFPFLEDELIAMRQQQEIADADLRVLRAENTQMKADARLMRGEIETYRESLDEVCEEKQQAETECRELREKAVKLNARISEYVRMEKQWLESNPDCTALRNENADLRKQLSEVCSQRCRLQQKSDEECDEIRSLQSMLDGVSMELKEKEDSVEEFKNQVSALQSQLEATFANSRNQTSSLSSDNKCSQDDVDALKLSVEKKDAELKDAKTELSRLRLDLEDVEQLKSEVARLRQLTEGVAADRYSNRVGAVSESVTIGDRTFSDYRSACEALAEESNTLRRELDGLKQENETLQLACESKFGERTMSDAVAACEELVKDRDRVLEQKEALEGMLEEMRAKELALNKRIESLVEQNEFMELEKGSFEEQEKENEEQIKLLQSKVADLNSQIETLKSNTVVFAGAGDEKDKDVRNIHEEMLSVQKSSTDAQSMLQDASKELSIANTTIESQNQEMETMRKELKRVSADLESFEAMTEITKAKYERKVDDLKRQLQASYDQADGQSGKGQNTSDNEEKYKNLLDEKELEIQDLRKQLAALNAKIDEAQLSLLQYKERIANLEQPISGQTPEIELKKFLDETKLSPGEIRERLATIEKLESVINAYKSEQVNAKESPEHELAKFMDEMGLGPVEIKERIATTKQLRMEIDALKSQQASAKESPERELASFLEQMGLSAREMKERLVLIEELQSEIDALKSERADTEEPPKHEFVKFVEETGLNPGEIKERLNLTEKLQSEIRVVNCELAGSRSQCSELERRLDEASGTEDERKLREHLAKARNELAEITEKYEKLRTVTQQAQGALLAENNRDLDQRRQLQMAETQRRESALEIAGERESANKQINLLLSKVSEHQTSLSKANVEKDIAMRESTKALQECEFLKQQVRELEKIHANEISIIPRGQVQDPEKLAAKIKSLQWALDIKQQTCQKWEGANQALAKENKKLEAEVVKVISLQGEVGKLTGILEQERMTRAENVAEQRSLRQQLDLTRERIVELGKQLKEVKGQLAVETEKFMTHSEAWSQEKATLDHKVEESRLRVNELNREIAAFKEKSEEFSEKDSYEAMEKMRISLEEAESREAENRKSIESLQDRLEHATKSLEEHKKAASEAEENLATVTSDVRSKSEELSAKNAFVKELQERIELFTQSVDKMREKIDARDLEIKSKDSKLSEFEETISRSAEELEKCEASLLLLTSEKEALENKISALESGSETEDLERETSYRVLLEQFEEVAQERDALQSRVCELEVSSAVEGEMGCDPECDKLESQQRQDLKDDLSKKEREIERLNLELDAARAQTASQKVSVSEYGMDFSMSIDQEMVDRLYDEISELKLQLEEKNDIIEGLGIARHCQDDDELIGLRREVVDLKLCMEQMARDAGEKDQSSVFGDQRNGSLSSDIKVEDQSNLFEDQKNASLSSDVKIELRSYILEDQRNTSLSSGLKVQDQSKICEDQRNTSLSSDLKVQDQRNTTLSNDLKNQDQSEICEDQRNIPLSSDLKVQEQSEIHEDQRNCSLSSDLKVQDQSEICEDQRNCSLSSDLKVQDQSEDQRNTTLSSDIKGDQRDFTALAEENGELRKKIAELREILRNNEICREKLLENADSAAVEELEALRKEKAAGEERISELTLMLRGEEDEMAAVKSQLLELGRSLEQENARIVELKRGKKEVEHEILRLQEKNKDLVQKLSTTDEPTVSQDRELEAQLKMSEAEIQRVEEVCRKLEAELDSYKDTHEAAVTARESIESLEKQLEDFNLAKERDISELNARVSDLTSENKELIDRLESLDESGDVKKELETALDTISSLEKKLEDCSLDKEKDITDMKELISALTTKNEELTEGLKRLDELDDKKKELEVSLGTISALEKQLEDCSLAKERDIAEMNARVSDLTSMNEELTDKLKNESDSEKKELETAADTISCLEKQLEDRTFALSDLTTRNEKLTERLKDLEGLDSEKKDLEKEVKRQKEKVCKLKENLESVYAMIREKAAVMEESASTREALESDFNELTNENERLKSRISELEVEQSSKCEKIDGEMRDADMLIEQLRGRVAELEEDRKRIADERDRCRDNAAALETEIGEVAEKIRCSKVELASAKHEIESLRVALKKKSQFESRVKDSDTLIESLRDELGLLREAKDSLERRVNEMETEEETRREVERREHEEKVKELSDGLARSEAGLSAAVEERETRSRELEEEREERSALTTEVEALKAQLDAVSKSRSDEIEALKCRLNDSRKAHADEVEALRGKIKEIEGSRNRGGEFETELKKNLEETKGMLYKKELEVQTLSSEVLEWQRRHEQDKLELNEAIQSAKDEVTAMEEGKQALVNDLREKVALLEQMNESLTEKLESAKEQDEMLGNVAKQQNEKHESEISELKEDYEKKLSDAKDDTKVRIERLLSKIDEYEQGLFEQDKELEAEQEKVKTLEQKVEELEGRLKTKANPKEPSMKTVKEHCRKLEAKYNQAKQQNQSLDNQLRAEKHRNSQLQSKVDEFVRAAPSSRDIARELVEKRRAKDAYDAELKKIKEEHSEETKVLADRMKRVKKELNEQVTHFEDKLIESEQELDQVKEKNKKLEGELAEMKSRPNVEENKELKKALHGKEREVSRLEIQLEHAKQPLQRENGRLKDELKVCEERIENLKQRVKLAASGKGSAERPQSRVGRVTRSGAAASQSGAPFDSKMCLLEMEVSDYKYRNDLLQCELDKCRDIEKKRMSENMELLELNNHYRSLIKKAREKKAAGGAEVLTENTAILNSASELPKSHTSQDDKCKNQ